MEIKLKETPAQKEVIMKMEDEIDQAANLFLLWNSAIAAAFAFYIIHVMTDGYLYLFLLVIFMLVVSWILLLTQLHDLASRYHQSKKQFILMNFGLLIIGTFYSFIKLTQK